MQGDADWPGKLPAEVEAFILETVEMLHELDDTGLHELTPLFYEHGFEQVAHSLREPSRHIDQHHSKGRWCDHC